MRLDSIIILLTLSFVFPISTQGDEMPVIPVSKYTLPNGMRILAVPRIGSPTVSCLLFYRVGSVDETPGTTGLAHFFEHMMFKGTAQIGVRPGMLERDRQLRMAMDEAHQSLKTHGASAADKQRVDAQIQSLLDEERRDCIVKDEIFGIYRDAGGTSMNAFTTNEFTCYMVEMPQESLETYFWVESDRMHNLEPREFYSEREVVRGERRMRYESKPSNLADMDIMKRSYAGTAYSWPVIGWAEDLDRVSCREAMDFYREHYHPGNAIMVLVGDVKPDDVHQLALKYFSPSNRTSAKVSSRTFNQQAPLGRSQQEYLIPDDDAVIVRYPLPPASQANPEPADLLIAFLNGRQGILHKVLVQEKKLARSCEASRDGFRDADHLTIRCVLRSSVRHDDALSEIERLVESIKASPLDVNRLASVKRREVIDMYRAMRNDFKLAMTLGHHELFGTWEDIFAGASRLQSCSADDVHHVLKANANPLVMSASFIRDTRVARSKP